MRLLGIDPGTSVMGYAVLDVEGNHASVVVLGSVVMNRVADPYSRLKRIFDRLNVIIEEFKPDELAIESPYVGKNIQSAIKLGRAQGVCMAAALTHNMPVSEYAPTRVKQAITGNGAATKEQIADMLQRMLHFSDIPKHLDATDALAIAYCHFMTRQTYALTSQLDRSSGIKIPKSSGRSIGWADYVKNNPDRVKR